MALWIACERGKKKNKFYVEVASNDQGVISVAPNAEKTSLWGRGITTESLAGLLFCPNLTTLIIRDTVVEELSGEIVYSMNVLKVLDLSDNGDLTRLPTGDGCLKNLEYLNIVRTMRLKRLPVEVSQWKKLRFLIVGSSLHIPRGVISSLCSLQLFEQQVGKLLDLTEQRRNISERESMERELLPELEGLKHIMDIHLSLHSATGIKILLNSPILQKCTTRLVVGSLPKMLDLGTETLTKHLERLHVKYCQMSEIKLGRPSLGNNLCEVYFHRCSEIQNLSSLIYVPNLSILVVGWCDSISELIGEETRSSNVGTSLFSSLTSLTLFDLRKLRSICPQSALPFPSLEYMKIFVCPSLRKLPLDSDTVSTIPQQFIIKGQREWREKLEWDSQATKDAFTPKFIDYYP